MNTLRLRLASLLLVATLIAGCTSLFPKTAALTQVHDTYRTEFAQLFLPGPPVQGQPAPPTNTPFAGTLRGIRDYRVKYGETSKEAAHLKVLEGMVYIQSGRVGMARLVQNDVAAAADHLKSADGVWTRDALFAKNFSSLALGWGEVADAYDKTADGKDLDETFPEAAKFLQAADALSASLRKEAEAGRLADPETDEGAIYLATTAAIFYDWAQVLFALRKDEDAGAKAKAEEIRSTNFPQTRELIGRFLSLTEKTAAADLRAGETVPAGRMRYLQWYQWLGQQSTPR